MMTLSRLIHTVGVTYFDTDTSTHGSPAAVKTEQWVKQFKIGVVLFICPCEASV